MATDDERREVARRLREYVDLPDDWWADTYSGFYVEKCAFGNVERHRESELFARLADLIEPSCDRDTPQKAAEKMFGKMRHSTKEEADAYDAMLKSKSVERRPIDRDALLALADEIAEAADYRMSRGEICAPIGIYVLRDYARRIREACGEVVG